MAPSRRIPLPAAESLVAQVSPSLTDRLDPHASLLGCDFFLFSRDKISPEKSRKDTPGYFAFGWVLLVCQMCLLRRLLFVRFIAVRQHLFDARFHLLVRLGAQQLLRNI